MKYVLILYDYLASHKDPHAFFESQFNYSESFGRLVKYSEFFDSDTNTRS